MDTDILILQLRQSGVDVPAEIGQVAFIDADGLYAILRSAAPLAGLATEAEVRKQFPAKLPTSSPSARFYALNSFDAMLKNKNNTSTNAANNANKKGGADDDDDDDGAGESPSTTEALMYPAEASTRAILSWLVAAIARHQDREAASAKKRKGGDDDDDDDEAGAAVGAPSVRRLLAGSMLHLRARMQDAQAVIGGGAAAKNNNASLAAAVATLVATPADHPMQRLHTYRRRCYVSSDDTPAAVDVVPAMIPVPAYLTASPAEAAGRTLADLSRVSRATNAIYGAPTLNSYRGKVFALSQAFAALHTPAAPTNKKGKKGSASSTATAATAYALDDASVFGKGGNRFFSSAQQQSAALGALGAAFFDTDAAGLNIGGSGGAAAAAAANRRQRAQERLDAANEQIADVEEKTKSAAQRAEEREAALAAIADGLSDAKRRNKELRHALAAEAEGCAAATEALEAAAEAIAAKEAALEERRAALAALQQRLERMDDYEGNATLLEGQIAEARALQRQVHDDLAGKLAKMEAKKAALEAEAAVAGDGRQEQLLALRNKVKKLKREIRAKTKEINDLHSEYDRVPKDIDRSLFLRFIFDMTSNIQRQQAEVDKVKTDLCREGATIGAKAEALQQLFSSVEQEVYKRAVANDKSSAAAAAASPTGKKPATAPTTAPTASASAAGAKSAGGPSSPEDDFAKDAFKRIVAVREAYGNLRAAIQSRGDVRHEVHIMEEKSSKAMRLGASQDLKKVAADLEAVEAENDELAAKLEEIMRRRGEEGGRGDGEEDDDDDEGENAEAAEE